GGRDPAPRANRSSSSPPDRLGPLGTTLARGRSRHAAVFDALWPGNGGGADERRSRRNGRSPGMTRTLIAKSRSPVLVSVRIRAQRAGKRPLRAWYHHE